MSMRKKFRAFISYSHKDTEWANWLHRTLEATTIEKGLIGQTTSVGPIPETLRPIFLDRADFAAAPSLSGETLRTLRDSDFLIVICSPNARASTVVNEEIEAFKALGREDRILSVVIDGEPKDPDRQCFPDALLYTKNKDGYSGPPHFPLAADARPSGDGRNGARLKLVAGLLGLALNVIVQREAVLQAQRRRRFLGAAFVAMVACFCVLYWYWAQRQDAYNAQSRAIATEARGICERGDCGTSLALALEVSPHDEDWRSRPFEQSAGSALLESVTNLRERKPLKGHSSYIKSAEFSREATRLLSIDVHGVLLLWDTSDTPTPNAPVQLQHQNKQFTSAHFSQDGSLIVAAAGSSVHVFDGHSGVYLEAATSHKSHISDVRFSPAGDQIVSSSEDGEVLLWSRHTKIVGTIRRADDRYEVCSVQFVDENFLLSPCRGEPEIRSRGGIRLATLATPTSWKPLVSTKSDIFLVDIFGRPWLYRSSEGRFRRHQLNAGGLVAAAFSLDGTLLATRHEVTNESAVRVWRVADVARGGAEPSEVFEPSSSKGGSVYFLGNSSRLFSLARGESARIWSSGDESARQILAAEKPMVIGGTSPDGRLAWSTSQGDNLIRLWGLRGAGLQRLIDRTKTMPPSTVRFEHGRVSILLEDGTYSQWEASNSRIQRVSPPADAVPEISLTSDRTSVWVLLRNENGDGVELVGPRLNVDAEKQIASRLHDEIFPVTSKVSPDGTRILTIHEQDGSEIATLWDLATRRHIVTHRGFTRKGKSHGFSQDGRRWWLCCDSNGSQLVLRHFSASDGAEAHSFPFPVTTDDFLLSPTGDRIAIDNGQSFEVFDLKDARQITVLEHASPVDNSLALFSFSSDGSKIVLTASHHGEVRVVDASTGKLIAHLPLKERPTKIRASPDVDRILAVEGRYKIKIIDVTGGTTMATLTSELDEVTDVAFLKNGPALVVRLRSPEGQVRASIVSVPWGQDLVRYACSLQPRPLSEQQRRQMHLTDKGNLCAPK